MKTVTEFPYRFEEFPDIGITMPDGCRLSARLWLPDGARQAPVPAVLEYLPYRKRDGTTTRDALTHPYLAGHGYACLRVDMRGNGDSEGLMTDEYAPEEWADALEVIKWIAAQDWSSGKVGMMGISWGGFNALQVAALAPPALKAVISHCSSADRYNEDIHYKGGCLLNENLGWGATMWAYSSRPADPALRPDWRASWLRRLEAEPFLPALWLGHQRRDGYWRRGSVCEDFGAIKAAVLAMGGWGDAYKNTVPALVAGLEAPVKGIIGPWVHKYPHFAVPEPRMGFLQEALRWWDRWLKGAENGAEDDPAYRVYLMDGVRPAAWYDNRPGRWLADPECEVQTLPLGPGGLGRAGDFTATLASPQHCGAAGGEYCAIWLGPEMPGDQRADDAFSACFDTDPLPATGIVGAPVLRLRLASDKPLAKLAVRLNHVHPDGASTRITWGVLNLAQRNSQAEPTPLSPGEAVEISVTLDHIAYALPAGHRLRIAVSSAYWPMLWPAPEPVTLTLTGGALDLPVMTGAGDCSFPPAEAAPALDLRILREERHIRRAETDQRTGIVSLVIEDDFGLAENPDHGLITGSVGRERWDIHPDDPLSARGEAHWTEELSRGNWSVRTEARCKMWSDRDHFHLWAGIEAYEGEIRIHAREVTHKVPRDHL